MPGFKTFKDRITVLLRGSVTGYILKPFVIWHIENLRVFKNINKYIAPVYCSSSKKSWRIQLLF